MVALRFFHVNRSEQRAGYIVSPRLYEYCVPVMMVRTYSIPPYFLFCSVCVDVDVDVAV